VVHGKRRGAFSDPDMNRAEILGEGAMEFEIINRFTYQHIFGGRARSLGELVERAVRQGISLAEANLMRADLAGVDLVGADLSRAYLYGANLSRAALQKADLSGAKISKADLSGAWLSAAKLNGEFNFIFLLDKFTRMLNFKFEIVRIGFRPHTNLFNNDSMLLFLINFLFFALLVNILSVIHYFADRRI
jgi:uncharacterized protein YjbI with pentapeptide repeats